MKTDLENATARTIDPGEREDDADFDPALRPISFDDYVGQEKIKANLRVFVQAARMRREALDHILFCGPPGLGKTTLAHIIAHELGVNLHLSSGPAVERKGDLAGVLTQLEEREVLFIDEIHRLNAVVEENLYPAMEDFRFEVVIGEGPHARMVPLELRRFTLIGATTRTGLLTSPLRDRFGYTARLEYYTPEELAQIVRRSARILKIAIDPGGADEIARRSRGTPRIANRLLRRVRDFAQVEGRGVIDPIIAVQALDRLEVDPLGLDGMDVAYLKTLMVKFDGRPVGIETLAAALSESRDTIEDVIEPFLLQQAFIQRTPRGRVATPRAYRHLQITPLSSARESEPGTLL